MDNNQKVFAHDRSKSVGASEVFGCLRKAFYSKTGAEEDRFHEDRWGAAERGNLIEDNFLVPAFVDHLPGKAEIVGAGDAQETLVDGKLSATPDGLIINLAKDALKEYGIDDIESDCIVAEFKSVDPRMTLFEEKSIHHGQVQTQLGLIRKLTDYDPMYGVIIYVNASFLDDIEVFPVKYNPKIFSNAIRRSKKVFKKGLTAADFIKEGKITGACEYCRFTDVCWNNTKRDTPGEERSNYEIAVLDEAERLALEYAEVRKVGKDAELRRKEMSEDIREFLRLNGTKKIATEAWTISNFLQGGRVTTDIKAMKEDGIDIDSYQKTGNGFEKLTVTIKKVK
jgi:CRISPR/Cas system-associated exonuclease Cas4 (RecB family)